MVNRSGTWVARTGSSAGGSHRSTRSAGARSGGKGGSGGRWAKRIGLGIVFTILGLVIAGAAVFLVAYARTDIPDPSDFALAETTTIYYNDGTTEIGTLSEINRTIIDADTLPDYVGYAVVSSEDRTFFTNNGVDLTGILRALWNNLRGGETQGGSTLSQQYVERYYVGETTSSYLGKFKETILALKINREQSKDEILGNYLNTVYFGRGAYGIEAAAQAYFGHSATELTVSESAMLAGILPAPSAWDPAVDPDQAEARWERVLSLMVEDGWISQAEADAQEFPEVIDSATQTDSLGGTTGYLVEQVRTELVEEEVFTEEEIDTGGLSIVTTIDKESQDAAVAAVEALPDDHSDNLRVALSSIDPETGEIVAEYAGEDYLTIQSNAVTDDVSQAGSTFKVFGLLAYAQEGGSLSDYFDGSSPQTFGTDNVEVSNDGGYSYGWITLERATRDSVNTAFVNMNEELGAEKTREAAVTAGIPEDTLGLDDTLTNILGTSSPHNIDLTTAYATIANGGSLVDAHIVREVLNSDDEVVYTADTSSQRVFSAEVVSEILPALEEAASEDGTGYKAAALDRPVAGKTGTTDDQMSAHFIGFIPQLVTGVSMYQVADDGSAESLTNFGGVDQFHGGDWPAQVWTDYMLAVTADMEVEDFDWVVESTPSATSTSQPSYQPTEESTPTPTPTPTVTTREPEEEAPTQQEEQEDQETSQPTAPTPTTSTPTPTEPSEEP